MTIVDKIKDELKRAMKSRDAELLSTMRMLVSAFRYQEIENKGELSQNQAIAILRKEAKKRTESVEAYRKADRAELADKEERELVIIEEYLPQQMSEDKVREIVEKVISEKKPENFGLAMKEVMAELKGKADGKLVSQILREVMS